MLLVGGLSAWCAACAHGKDPDAEQAPDGTGSGNPEPPAVALIAPEVGKSQYGEGNGEGRGADTKREESTHAPNLQLRIQVDPHDADGRL